MKRLALLLVFFLCCADVYAADKTFTWTNPTENTDGTALDQSTLTAYDIGCTSVTGDPYQVIESFPATQPLPTTRTVSLAPGDYWCVIRVSTANASSEWSAEVFFTLAHPVPIAPSDLSVD